MKNRILHIADDSIFLDYAIEQFESVAPGLSVYLVNTREPQNIKLTNKIIALDSVSDEYQRIICKIDNYSAVIIHALTAQKAHLVNKIKGKVNIVWFFWGADGFYLKGLISEVYSEKTKRFLNTINNINIYKKIKSLILSYDIFSIPYYLICYHRLPEDYQKRKAIKRMNFCVPVIEDDYFFLKKRIQFTAQLIHCNYGSIDKYKGSFLELGKREKTPILVGNSGDPANNHIDIFDMLKKMNFNNDIITPLSYGNKEYIKHVEKYGKELFGPRLIPILDFIPLEEYNKLIANCSIVIMNHYVQQAMGNIIFTLWRGAKLFISRKSTVYDFLNRNKVVFYTIEEDLKRPDAFTPLRDFERDINRNFVNANYSEEEVLKKTASLVKIITTE